MQLELKGFNYKIAIKSSFKIRKNIYKNFNIILNIALILK